MNTLNISKRDLIHLFIHCIIGLIITYIGVINIFSFKNPTPYVLATIVIGVSFGLITWTSVAVYKELKE